MGDNTDGKSNARYPKLSINLSPLDGHGTTNSGCRIILLKKKETIAHNFGGADKMNDVT